MAIGDPLSALWPTSKTGGFAMPLNTSQGRSNKIIQSAAAPEALAQRSISSLKKALASEGAVDHDLEALLGEALREVGEPVEAAFNVQPCLLSLFLSLRQVHVGLSSGHSIVNQYRNKMTYARRYKTTSTR